MKLEGKITIFIVWVCSHTVKMYLVGTFHLNVCVVFIESRATFKIVASSKAGRLR